MMIAGKEPNRNSSSDQPQELQQRQPRSGPPSGDHQGNGELQSEQAAGIVNQAFAFQHVDNSPGKAQAFGDRGRSDRIRGRDDCSQHRSQPVVKARNQPAVPTATPNTVNPTRPKASIRMLTMFV